MLRCKQTVNLLLRSPPTLRKFITLKFISRKIAKYLFQIIKFSTNNKIKIPRPLSTVFLYTCYVAAIKESVHAGIAQSASRYSDWLRAGRLRGWSSSPGRVKNFIFSASTRPVLRPAQPSVQWAPRALSPKVKRQGREASHSPPASAEVKKMRIYTSTPSYAFMG
jgi:hypothetical protein